MAVFEKDNNVNVWWFPREFCQSRFGEYRKSGTNSCTLISLILADKVSKELVFHVAAQTLPHRAVDIFGDAMNEGNRVYSRIFDRNDKKITTPNLNIPEALSALGDQMSTGFDLQEWFYTHLTANPSKETYKHSVSLRLVQVLKLAVQLFTQTPSNARAKYLFAALIADNRTTLFVFEFPINMVSFFDSHQHRPKAGAVFAQCSVNHLENLCLWLTCMIDDVFNSQPSVYEISFLTIGTDAPNLESPQGIN